MPLSPAQVGLLLKARDHTITLTDAISIALATNRDLAFAGEALYKAEGRTAEVKSALYPTISANPADVFLHNSLQPGYGVQATLPIDITGLLRSATDQARYQEIGTRLDINRTRNQTVYNVENAFYTALRTETLVKVATENLQNSLDRLKDAQTRYSVQTVAYFDVLRAQTDVANAQKQVIQARNAVSNAIANLNLTMGIDVTTPLHISEAGAVAEPPGVSPPSVPPVTPTTQVPVGTAAPDVPTALAPKMAGPDMQGLTAQKAEDVIADALRLGPEFQTVLKEALETRPEILEAGTQIAAARKGILIAKRSALPSLSVSVGYFDVRNQTGTTRIDEPQAIVGLNIPIDDAGLARARVQEAKADVSNAITNKRQQTDFVTLDVQQAYLNLVQARDQVAVANQALGQARAGFDIARVRYNAGIGSRAGISPLLEVSDAQAALTLAEQNQVNALYDYNGARAQLDRSIGRFSFVPNAPGYGAIPSAKVVGRPDH